MLELLHIFVRDLESENESSRLSKWEGVRGNKFTQDFLFV